MILLLSFSTLQQSDSLMRSLFTIIIFVTTSHAHAQISRDSLIGSWVCTQVKELPDPELKDPSIRQSFDIIKAAYLGSTFSFGADGKFYQTLTKTKQDLSEMLKFLNGQNWYLSTTTTRVSIGLPEENIMFIDIDQQEDGVYFVVFETPLLLKMQKK